MSVYPDVVFSQHPATGSTPIIPNPRAIPPDLIEREQWCCWKYVWRVNPKTGKGEWTKEPINPWTGGLAKTNEPSTWGPFDIAMQRVKIIGEREELTGVGFVISEDDPYTGGDYDDHRDPQTGKIDPIVEAELEELNGYAEVSPSGTGVKVIVRGKKPGDRCKNTALGVEMYDQHRFFTITGAVVGDYREINDAQEAIEKVYARAFPEPEEEPTPRPSAGVVDLDDKRLLKKARNWRKGRGRHFRKLYDDGDASGYASHSEADFALLGYLAFITGGDAKRMAQLFRESALHRPEKGEDYVERSVRSLLRNYRGDFYNPKKRAEEATEVLSGEFWEAVYRTPWSGVSGPTKHNLLIALAMEAMEKGVPKGNGASVRTREEDLSKLAGCSAKTARKNLHELAEIGWVEIRRDYRRKAQEYTLKIPDDVPSNYRTRCSHTRACELPSPVNHRQIGELLRFRWGRSAYAKVARVGKSCGLQAHYLFAAGGDGLTTTDLAEITDRRKDNVRSNLRRLLAAGLVEEISPDRYALVAGFWLRLDEELENSGIKTAERLQEAREHRVVEAASYWEKHSESDPAPPSLRTERYSRRRDVRSSCASLLKHRADLRGATVEDLCEASTLSIPLQPEEAIEFLEDHGLPIHRRPAKEPSPPDPEQEIRQLIRGGMNPDLAREEVLGEVEPW